MSKESRPPLGESPQNRELMTFHCSYCPSTFTQSGYFKDQYDPGARSDGICNECHAKLNEDGIMISDSHSSQENPEDEGYLIDETEMNSDLQERLRRALDRQEERWDRY